MVSRQVGVRPLRKAHGFKLKGDRHKVDTRKNSYCGGQGSETVEQVA